MRRPLAMLGVTGLVLAGAGLAAAEEPVSVSDPISDEVGAFGEGEPAVRAAIGELAADSEIALYAVMVSSFDGDSDTEWVEQTAQRSELEGSAILLAVAVGEDTYEYGWWIDESFPLSEVEVEDVIVSEVVPKLDSLNWDSAVITLAQRLRSMSVAVEEEEQEQQEEEQEQQEEEQQDEQEEEQQEEEEAWTATTTLAVIGGVAVVLIGAYLFTRRRTPADPSL